VLYHFNNEQSSGLFKQPESEFKSKWLQDYMQQWKGKPLHGQFPSQLEALTTANCAYKWLHTSGLKIETKALLCAAQDQAISTNAFKVNIMGPFLSWCS